MLSDSISENTILNFFLRVHTLRPPSFDMLCMHVCFPHDVHLLNQARAPGFLKSFCSQTLLYVCVSAPEAINNKSREWHA